MQVAEALRKEGWIPDVLICSNAVRSRQTLEEMRSALPELEDADVHFLGSLYTISQLDGQTRAHLETIVVTEADDGHRCVLCLGHNKGWEEAATSYAVRKPFCRYMLSSISCDTALLTRCTF